MILAVYYVTTPLGTDVQINVAFAQQARLVGSFPTNLVEAWTLRGIGYKLLVYVPYVITDAVVNYYNKPRFELVYRTVVLLSYLAVVGLSAGLARSRLRASGYDVRSVVFLVVVSFLSVSHYIAFQPGDVAALLTLLGVALAISDRRWTTTAAGVVFASLATIKGITVLYALVGALLILGYEGGYRPYYRRLGISTVVAGLALGGLLSVVAPRTVTDLLVATQFQSTLNRPLLARLQSAVQLGPFRHIPVLAPAGVAGLGLVVSALRSRNYRRLLLVAGLFVVPALYVVVQSKGFAYHFTAFLPAAVGICLLAGHIEASDDRRYSSLLVLATLLIALSLVSPLGLSSWTAANDYERSVRAQADVYDEIRAETGLSESDTVLYLADGTATYYLGAESYLRYYYPLPLQRPRSTAQLRESQVARHTYAKALAYDGRYVVRTAWFDLEPLPRLRGKLRTEYRVVYRGSPEARYERAVVVYERRPDE